MKRIIIEICLVLMSAVVLAMSTFVVWLLVRMSPHSPEFYLLPFWQQQLQDIALVVALLGSPVLTGSCLRSFYNTLLEHDKKERIQ